MQFFSFSNYFTSHNVLKIHSYWCKWQFFLLLMAEKYPLYKCITFSSFMYFLKKQIDFHVWLFEVILQ